MAGNDIKGVMAVIDRYLAAYRAKDIGGIAACIAQDPNFLAFGTDEGECWSGWESYRGVTESLFRAAEEIEWKRGETHIGFSRDGSIAWFGEDLVGRIQTRGTKTDCAFRLSGTMEKRNGNWTIVQFHRSVPIKGYAVPYLEAHGVRFD